MAMEGDLTWTLNYSKETFVVIGKILNYFIFLSLIYITVLSLSPTEGDCCKVQMKTDTKMLYRV